MKGYRQPLWWLYGVLTFPAYVAVLEPDPPNRDLANGERVKWCEEHRASADEDTCWSGAVFSGSTPCRIVSKLLVDPPTEED